MLNLEEVQERIRAKGRPYAELLPWMVLIEPGLVLNKDGSLLACFRIGGVDLEGKEQIDIDRYSALAEHAMRNFDERITVWWTVDRRRTKRYPEGGEFPDDISKFIDNQWRSIFVSGNQYENKHYLSVLYSPTAGTSKFMDVVGEFSMHGLSMPKAMLEAIKVTFGKASAFGFIEKQLEREAKQFREMLIGFHQTVTDLNAQRLEGDELLAFLHDRSSPATYGQRVRMPNPPAYLDGYLNDNTLHVGHEKLLFDHNDPVYVAATSMKSSSMSDFPPESTPGLLDGLLAVPAEVTISQCFRFTEQGETKKYIDGVRKHNLNSQKSFLTYINEALTNTESDKRDEGKVMAAQDASNALASISAFGRMFGYYNITVLSYGKNSDDLDDSVKMVTQVINNCGFIAVREKLHLLSAWSGTMPGQWGEIVRWYFLSTGNLADIATIRTIAPGEIINQYLSDQTQRRLPALTVLSTEYGVPFYFNFHHGALAHTMVIGPTRAGKTIFVLFLLSQFRKYAPCQIYIFDKDYSCEVPTLMHGGRYLDLAGQGASGAPKMNPLKLLGDDRHLPFLMKWLELILTSRGYEFEAKDDKAVEEALLALRKLPENRWQLKSLNLPGKLAEQLAQWIGQGSKAKYFDNEEDSFELSDWTACEIGSLFEDTRLATAFLDYAFYRITMRLDGRPTAIYLPEFWFMLKDERFKYRIDNWLRTLAKKNAFLIFDTQSLGELSSSDIFGSLIDNIPNKIFVPNPSAYAHIDLYMSKFGLNRSQIERIRNAIKNQQYYLVGPTLSRMAIALFPPQILACLRSDARAREVFHKHYARRNENAEWREDYIVELTR